MPFINAHNVRMARNLDIALLRAFVTIADHGSMTAAGHALHLTQGAVSQQIARLEALSGPLFFRDHRDLRLTSAGERLLGDARRLLAFHDALWTEMTAGAVEGTVRLGAPQDLIGTLLGPILKGYAQAHPQVELTLVCAASPELMRTLKRGEIDIALIEELPGSSRGEGLAIDRLVWVGARGELRIARGLCPSRWCQRHVRFAQRCSMNFASTNCHGVPCSKTGVSMQRPPRCAPISPLRPGLHPPCRPNLIS